MRTRDAVLEYQKTLDDAGTYSKDISLVDPVSAFALEFEAKNGATYNKDNFLSDVITKIEIVDGSEVLYSLNLSELEALHFYKTGVTPTLFPSEWAAGTQRHACLLMFGRKLWDPDYAMDFTRFKNPQIKLTSNLSAIRAANGTGFDTATLKATIVAKVMEQMAGKPNKYLMAKQIVPWTSGTSGEKRLDLPVDRVYRMLMARLYVSGSDVDEVATNLKITMDTDAFIPINRKVQQLDAEAFAKWGLMRCKHDFFRSGSTTARLIANKEPCVTGWVKTPGTPRVIVPWAQWSSNWNIELYDMAGALDGTDRQITAMEEGHAIHATVPIPFGDMGDPASWFDPRPYKKMEAVFTEAVAATCSLVAELVRPL